KSLEWMAAGYLRPFELDELSKRLPNYLKIWTNEEWDSVLKLNRFSDNKLYYIPGKRTLKVNSSWKYRKDLFDSYNLKFPQTANEMYAAAKTIKEKTGLIPFITNGSSASPLFGITVFFQLFNLPDLLLNWVSY